jgi:hypothetical protein
MRTIYVIAAFAFATVVCADVAPSNSGMTEVISLQSRILRGEVHESRIRRHIPVDITSGNDGTSALATAGGDQAPPSRKRKRSVTQEEALSTENGGGVSTTHEKPITGTVRKPRYAEQTHGPSGTLSDNHLVTYHQPKSTLRNAQITENGGSVVSPPSQPSTGSLTPLRRQYAQLDLASFASKMSSMRIGQGSGRSSS